MTTQIDIKSSFDDSGALRRHIERRVDAALRSHAPNIEHIALRLFDANGPRSGADDKVVRITVRVKTWGRVAASAATSDVYRSVDRAVARLKETMRRRRSRLNRRQTRGAFEGLPADAD
jgi:ribosomal subunit interface protein